MLERLYECFGTEERIGLICHINGMEMGWMNFVIENIYEEGDVVRVETGDSYIRLEPKLYARSSFISLIRIALPEGLSPRDRSF